MTATMRFEKWENSTGTKSVTMDQMAGGSGLVPVIPTSVSTGTGTATFSATSGKVSFNSTSSTNNITVNGCFTSTYTNYKIFLTLTSGQANGQYLFQLTQSGTPNTAAYMTLNSGGSTTTGGSSIELMFANYTTGTGSTSLDVYQPNEAINTTVTHDWFYDDGGTFQFARKGTRHRQAVAYDGFKISGATSSIGSIQVYGYR